MTVMSNSWNAHRANYIIGGGNKPAVFLNREPRADAVIGFNGAAMLKQHEYGAVELLTGFVDLDIWITVRDPIAVNIKWVGWVPLIDDQSEGGLLLRGSQPISDLAVEPWPTLGEFAVYMQHVRWTACGISATEAVSHYRKANVNPEIGKHEEVVDRQASVRDPQGPEEIEVKIQMPQAGGMEVRDCWVLQTHLYADAATPEMISSKRAGT
ncbi:hypothetical protein BDR03DRAFT_996335 [Suillus americanus]|nr:hypothetical protein BDR03DRAFT_996335 [Suillus americanus]